MFSYSTIALVSSLFFTQVLSKPVSPTSTYDYVIVGGGTAGLALAARLTEDNFASVAVIEAGTYYQIGNPLLGSTPAGDGFFVGNSPDDTNSAVDWNFVTVPQVGGGNRSMHYPRGKCLGGSSGRNFMIYQRADKGSLQLWADTVDDQSYTFDNMLPYYEKSVNFTAPGPSRAKNATAEFNAKVFSSTGGPLHVSYPNYAQPFSTYLSSAFNEIGVLPTQDFNSGSLMGSSWASHTIDPTTAIRSSSQTSYLTEAESRPNLKLFQLTLAKKILFDKNKNAIGVLIDDGSTIMAKKEVILSAGAFQSPQLLMVSGIGPATTLRKLNIPIVADLPGVGQNMSDHILFGPSYRVQVETLSTLLDDPSALSTSLTTEYFPSALGPLTNPQADFLAWEKTPRSLLPPKATSILSKIPASWPEIEYFSFPGFFGNISNTRTDTPDDGFTYASILGAIVAPQSRGTVEIISSDTSDLPIINPNWLTDPTDQAVAIAAYKRVKSVFASKSIQPVLVDQTYFPGNDIQSDEEILEYISNNFGTVYHASTTCRMGKKGDRSAVVDTLARVFGVKGLRVVDASSLAVLPPGHPQSIVYAFAERIADEIKKGN